MSLRELTDSVGIKASGVFIMALAKCFSQVRTKMEVTRVKRALRILVFK